MVRDTSAVAGSFPVRSNGNEPVKRNLLPEVIGEIEVEQVRFCTPHTPPWILPQDAPIIPDSRAGFLIQMPAPAARGVRTPRRTDRTPPRAARPPGGPLSRRGTAHAGRRIRSTARRGASPAAGPGGRTDTPRWRGSVRRVPCGLRYHPGAGRGRRGRTTDGAGRPAANRTCV